MARTLYALFVGIDNYPAGDGLDHSYESASALYNFVCDKRRTNAEWSVQAKILHDKDAKRQHIIRELESLAKAKQGDVCLFYYAGHGSYEPRDHAARTVIKEDKLETILCVDSRTPGILDLADKELAYIIHKIVNKGVHFVAIMDCCNSGNNTREEEYGLKVSTAAPNIRPRKLEEFYGYKESKPNFPVTSKHVQMAACLAEGRAYDGLFTKTLLEVLTNKDKAAKIPHTYDKIMEVVKAKIKTKQTPDLADIDPNLNAELFLKGALKLGQIPIPKP